MLHCRSPYAERIDSDLVGAADGGLGRCQTGDRDAVGRTRHVVHTDVVAEDYRFGVAAVLAADADLKVGTGLAAEADRFLDHAAHASLVDGCEWVGLEDFDVLVELRELRVV